MSTNLRPWTGLSPEEALKKWSDPDLYAAMLEFADAWLPVSTAKGHPPSNRVLRYEEYRRRRNAVEAPFLDCLQRATLLASAVPKGERHREIVEPSLWTELELDFYFAELFGNQIRFSKPEFFAPNVIPLNVREVPLWLERYIGYCP